MGDKLCYYFSESELEIDKQFYRNKLLKNESYLDSFFISSGVNKPLPYFSNLS